MPVLTGAEAEAVNLDYESLAAAGTMLGSGGMIVIDEETCMVWALAVLEKFYAHESCGQCTPCREGTGWLRDLVYAAGGGRGHPRRHGQDPLDHPQHDRHDHLRPLRRGRHAGGELRARSSAREFEAHVGAGRCPIRRRADGAAAHGMVADGRGSIIDDREIEVADGTEHDPGGAAAGDRDPALLLPPGARASTATAASA